MARRRAKKQATVGSYILSMIIFFVIGGVCIGIGFIEFLDGKKIPVDFNTVTADELESGMVLEGDLYSNFGAFMESYRTRYGIKTGSSTYYYMIPVGEKEYMALQGSSQINSQLDLQANKLMNYLSGYDTDLGTVHIKGKLVKMGSEDRGYLEDYMRSLGFSQTEINSLIVPYTLRYSNFKGYGAMLIMGAIFLVIGLIYGIPGILRLKKQNVAINGNGYNGGYGSPENGIPNGSNPYAQNMGSGMTDGSVPYAQNMESGMTDGSVPYAQNMENGTSNNPYNGAGDNQFNATYNSQFDGTDNSPSNGTSDNPYN